MASGFIDFKIQENVFSTDEMKMVFDERSRIERWLKIESVLAEVQAENGVIPQEAAEVIAKNAHIESIDIEAIHAEYESNRNSLLPVLMGLRRACGTKHGEYVHYGATTQDIVDTGQVMEIKQSMRIFYRDLRKLEEILLVTAKEHIDTAMIGRSHSQHGLPITYGLKVSVWMTEIRRHIERIKSLAGRVLIGQLSGAVGTMAAYGDKAWIIRSETLKKLGLKTSQNSWHTSRDNIAEVSHCFAMIATTMAKMANEVFQLGKTEVLELRESTSGKKTMSSSAMPHKRNPVLCERIVVMSKHVRALSCVVLEAMDQENERDPRSLWSEWLAIPQLAIYTGTALHYSINVFQNLEIDIERMRKNLKTYGEMVVSEYLLYALAPYIGKMNAQEKLHKLIRMAEKDKMSFKEILIQDREVGKYIKDKDIHVLDHPELYTGHAKNIVNAVIHDIEHARKNESEDCIM